MFGANAPITVSQAGPLTVVQQGLQPVQQAGYTVSLAVPPPSPSAFWYLEISAAPETKATYEVGGGAPDRIIRHAAMNALTSVRGQEAPGLRHGIGRLRPRPISRARLRAPVGQRQLLLLVGRV